MSRSGAGRNDSGRQKGCCRQERSASRRWRLREQGAECAAGRKQEAERAEDRKQEAEAEGSHEVRLGARAWRQRAGAWKLEAEDRRLEAEA